jgi:two-component system LytT family response regulator
MVSTIIIDDDYVSRMVLREMLKNFPECEILGEAGSVTDGLKLISDSAPELVFLDISLPDGTGFDLLDRVKNSDFKLIFITAYSEYAIKAFKYDTFDYLVKPLSPEDLSKALLRLPQFQRKENGLVSLSIRENLAVPIEKNLRTVALPDSNGFAIIRVEDIVRCEG